MKFLFKDKNKETKDTDIIPVITFHSNETR